MLTLINSHSPLGHNVHWALGSVQAQYGQCSVSGLKTASRGSQMLPASPGGLAYCLPRHCLSRTIMAKYFHRNTT